MRILVTGAQGCIGAWVVKGLLERGMDVVAFDLDPEPSRLGLIVDEPQLRKVVLEAGAIQDTARVKSLVRDAGITHIVHLAAVLMPFCKENPVEGAMVNVIGTLNVFEAAREAGRSVRVAYASSAAVWGPEEVYGSGMLNEDDPLKPTTHYGVFKQANEGNARAFYAGDGISSIGLRPWTVYGVGRDRGLTADPTIAMKAAVEGKPYEIRVSGFMDLQYVEDVAQAFIECALSPLEGAHVFILQGAVVDMQDLVGVIERLRPGSGQLLSVSGPQVPVAVRVDDSQLRSKIPNLPRTPLEEGVAKTLEIFERLKREARLPA